MPLFFLALGLLLRDEGKFLVHALTAAVRLCRRGRFATRDRGRKGFL